MNIKSYIRKGIVNESSHYRKILDIDDINTHKYIILILEGKGRRKLQLTGNRFLYESYFPNTFIGIEDILLKKIRKGTIDIFPGAHYILWNIEDFLSQLAARPNLAKLVINSFSKRIRLYDQKRKKIDFDLLNDIILDDYTDPSQNLISDDALYQMSFASQNDIPEDIIQKFSQKFIKGEYITKIGDNSQDLFIILNGSASVYIESTDTKSKEQIDTITVGDMVGEMSLFDRMPRSADVVADDTVLSIRLTPENFNVLFNLHSKWSLKLIESLCERIESRREKLETIDIEFIQ